MNVAAADSLTDRVALVTGASGGIGGAIAIALARSGANVHAVGRDKAKLSALGERAGRAGRLSTHAVDLTRDSDLETLVREVTGVSGRLDVLVHSAGRILYGKIADSPVAQLDELYAGNVRAPYLLTRLCLPSLATAEGQVVFINSSTGVAASAGLGAYSATQHALKALTDALRDEVNPAGVRVFSVYPGRTASALMKQRFEMEGRAYRPELLLQPEDIASVVLNSLLLPRTAEVTNVSIRPMKKSY
jgi:NADP-dependent 3-hydroxy acid dehydrogenase YdfG